jgi:hypothetical protein
MEKDKRSGSRMAEYVICSQKPIQAPYGDINLLAYVVYTLSKISPLRTK